jgi:hypothetical protein
MEDKISPQTYKLMYGRDMASDAELESRARYELASYYEIDEGAIQQSRHWNRVACNRVNNIWVWEKLLICLRKTFKPENEFEE